jgi:hypothetical protein
MKNSEARSQVQETNKVGWTKAFGESHPEKKSATTHRGLLNTDCFFISLNPKAR